jgi:hypothetical protein
MAQGRPGPPSPHRAGRLYLLGGTVTGHNPTTPGHVDNIYGRYAVNIPSTSDQRMVCTVKIHLDTSTPVKRCLLCSLRLRDLNRTSKAASVHP